MKPKIKKDYRKPCFEGGFETRKILWKGFGFGLTSGVITTLGVIVGLHSGTHSRLAVMVGLIVLAIADALSDAMGIHVSEEAEMEHTTKELWQVTLFTFTSKLFFTLTFIVPIAFLELETAIAVSIGWGLLLITVFSFYLGKFQQQSPYKIIAEHVIIAALVVLIAHSFGDLIYSVFRT